MRLGMACEQAAEVPLLLCICKRTARDHCEHWPCPKLEQIAVIGLEAVFEDQPRPSAFRDGTTRFDPIIGEHECLLAMERRIVAPGLSGPAPVREADRTHDVQ